MKKINLLQYSQNKKIKFGTSGIRTTNEKLTDKTCYLFTLGFIKFLESNKEIQDKVAIAGDLRPSTDRISQAVIKAIHDKGYEVVNCGKIPTPSVTFYGIENSIPSIMITGSHIPFDRNGIKFNKKDGEILKSDEEKITDQEIYFDEKLFDANNMFSTQVEINIPDATPEAQNLYKKRFTTVFPRGFLKGKRIGVYGQSAIGRDLIAEMLKFFGAEIKKLGYSDTFVPFDTEAILEKDIKKAKTWTKKHNLDALVTTDGDSDRPLIADETGTWINPTLAGILTAKLLKADAVSIVISSNTLVEQSKFFNKVIRTKIGSPYVVQAMKQLSKKGYSRVVSFESNGGFLTNNDIEIDDKTLKALPTRDAFTVIIALLYLSYIKNKPLKALSDKLPKRYTRSTSIKEFPTIKSHNWLKKLESSKELIEKTFSPIFGEISNINTLDGLRITFKDSSIVHLRPSGNAPEFRCYTEATSKKEAKRINKKAQKIMLKVLEK